METLVNVLCTAFSIACDYYLYTVFMIATILRTHAPGQRVPVTSSQVLLDPKQDDHRGSMPATSVLHGSPPL